MAIPFLRRLLLPFIGLILISILLRKSQHRDTEQPQYEVLKPILRPHRVTAPFVNNSHLRTAVFPGKPQTQEKDGIHVGLPMTPKVQAKSQIPIALQRLTRCPKTPNRFTNHIRLSNMLYNISMSPRMPPSYDDRRFWNPTIIALPSWAENQ